jgi:hypothetical protein
MTFAGSARWTGIGSPLLLYLFLVESSPKVFLKLGRGEKVWIYLYTIEIELDVTVELGSK